MAADRRRSRRRQHRRVRRLGPSVRRHRRARRSAGARRDSGSGAHRGGRRAGRGDRAIAWPVSPGVVGTLAVWNLATGRLEHDLTLPAPPREVALDPAGARVLAATRALAHAVERRRRSAPRPRRHGDRVRASAGVFRRRRLCRDCRARRRREVRSTACCAARTRRSSARSKVQPTSQGWELGPGGRYVALQGPETVVRVLETRRGAELRRLAHAQPSSGSCTRATGRCS